MRKRTNRLSLLTSRRNLLVMKNSNISFLGGGKPIKVRSFLTYQVKNMKPSPLFAKQSINTPRNKLTPWGDVDLDGTPNKFDCNPFRADKDKMKVVYDDDGWSLKDVEESKAKKKKKGFSFSKAVSGLVGGLGTIVSTPSFNPKTGRYTKESLREQRRLSGRTLRAVRLLTPQGTVPVPTGKTGTGKRGRPPRPSGRYVIPGVGAVGVYEYRSWLRQQKKVRRLAARASSSATSAGGYFPRSQLKESSATQYSPGEQENLETTEVPAEQFNQLDTDIAMLSSPTQIKPVGTSNLSVPEQTQLVQQQQLQLAMQQRDNVLLAPQFMKGDLAARTADSIISDKGRPNILQAPNAFLGQLRNLQPRNPIELGERPISNPRGDYFTTIDPITGNPVLQRRIREKWLSGEAI